MAILEAVFANKPGQTPQEVERRRRMAQALIESGAGGKPPSSGLELAGRLAMTLTGQYQAGKAERQDATNRANASSLLAKTLLGEDPYSQGSGSPIPSPGAAAQMQQTSPSPSGNPDTAATEAYIREAAAKRGIDPEVAVKVARSEGLAPGVWQSNVVRKDGRRETSYGPFQLLVGGGLGDKFQKVYGKSPSDPSTLNQQIDFALDEAATGGWSPWYGAAKVGVGARTGLNNARALGYQPSQVASLDPAAGMSQQPMPAPEAQAQIQGPQPPAPALPPPTTVPNAPPVASVPQPKPGIMASSVPGQQPAPPPMEVAQTSPAKRAQIAELLQNPYTQEAGQQMLMEEYRRKQDAQNLILKQRLEQSDPKYRQDLEKGGLELENLKNPKMSPTDQANIELSRDKFELDKENSAVTPDIKEYKFAKDNGYTGSFAQYQIDMKKSAANNMTINTGEGNKFYNTLDEKNAGIFSGLSDTGIQARSTLGQIDALDNLLKASPTGWVGAMKQAAGEYGINTEGLSDIQAATALINKMVPTQRQPGSGTMSDADLALFKQSLPRIINQPGGNQTIINTIRGISQYQVQMGEIADRVANRELTPAEGRSAIAALPNPLSNFKAPPPGKEEEGWTTVPTDVPGVTIRRKN